MFILNSIILFFAPVLAFIFYILFIIFRSIANVIESLIDIIKPVIMIAFMLIIAALFFLFGGYFFSNEFEFTNRIIAGVAALGFVALLLIIGAAAYLRDMIRNDNLTFDSFVLVGIVSVFATIATTFERIFMFLIKAIGKHIQ